MSENLLIEKLRSIVSATDEVQLQILSGTISEIDESNLSVNVCRELLSIFERFPNDDGFGIFWDIIHLLEINDNYKIPLLVRARKFPTEFSLTMVNRILNSNDDFPDKAELMEILKNTSINQNIPNEIRIIAEDFLSFQLKKE